jgi:hypothetical protein
MRPLGKHARAAAKMMREVARDDCQHTMWKSRVCPPSSRKEGGLLLGKRQTAGRSAGVR